MTEDERILALLEEADPAARLPTLVVDHDPLWRAVQTRLEERPRGDDASTPARGLTRLPAPRLGPLTPRLRWVAAAVLLIVAAVVALDAISSAPIDDVVVPPDPAPPPETPDVGFVPTDHLALAGAELLTVPTARDWEYVAEIDGRLWLGAKANGVPDGLMVLAAVDGTILGTPDIDRQCTEVAAADRWVWVGDCATDTLQRIDPSTLDATLLPLPGEPVALDVGDDGLVRVLTDAADCSGCRLVTVEDTAAGTTSVLELDLDARDVVSGAGLLWLAAPSDGGVHVADPTSGAIVAIVPETDGVVQLIAGPATIFALDHADSALSRIDPDTRTVAQAIDVGPLRIDIPANLAVAAGDLWMAGEWGGEREQTAFLRVDGTTGEIQAVGPYVGIGAIDLDAEHVWLTSWHRDEGRLYRIPLASLEP